jgi:hypothetical protein
METTIIVNHENRTLRNAVENYSDGKLLKTKDEREADYSN